MIKTTSIPRSKLPIFSTEEMDLIYNQEELSEFIGLPFDVANFKKQIEKKEKFFSHEQRQMLADTLEENYKELPRKKLAQAQIKLLKEKNTYTITTGHQLCLYGGPLYFFLKIIHTIRLSEVLKEHYPEYNFIPIFWMASEDHDSEEIQSLHLFGKTITWNHDQIGAVGRFDTRNIAEVKKQLLELFRAPKGSEVDDYLNALEGKTYGDAFKRWVHHIFGDRGLLVLDADQKELKKQMIPIFQKELLDNFSNGCIEQTNEALLKEKRTTQIYSRKINVFFTEKNKRNRIIENGKGIYTLGDKSLAKDELISLLNKHPDFFSPNVALRPIYQELILPNLCYIGGMAELKYWTQLKSAFENCTVPYPMIQLRSNLLWIDKNVRKNINHLGLKVEELFDNTEMLQKKILSKSDMHPIDEAKISSSVDITEKTYQESIKNNPELESWLGAELNRIRKQYKSVQHKIEKSKKNTFDAQLKKVAKVKENLFPSQKLQERKLNLLHFCNSAPPKNWIEQLYSVIDPLSKDFTILIESETKQN